MQNDLFYQIALTQVPQIGDIVARHLLQAFGSGESVFKTSFRKLACIEGIGSIRAASIKKFTDFQRVEKELDFLLNQNLRAVSILEKDYPEKLMHCPDAPILLYAKGDLTTLNHRSIAVIGTRHASPYGKQWCQEFIRELREQDINIVSGLAYGIDATAHQAALENNMHTTAVLAHGMHTIYPPQHASLASVISQRGLLVTDYISGTPPDKQNFPKRNRITAGLCEAIIVVETGSTGGSMITAELANQYHREVFAVPGRSNDSKSKGCHALIRNHKAQIITSAAEFLENMGWSIPHEPKQPVQLTLPIHLSKEERLLLTLIKQQKNPHIDWLHENSEFSHAILSTTLLQLELLGHIQALAGKRYQLTLTGFQSS